MAAAGVFRPSIAVGAWALPTIIAHGTPEQQERFVGPTLEGTIGWCQLFSEPGAGSDLAALSMRAMRDTGGFVLNGQKVWTSMAQKADWGICLARTDPEAPKHEGITYFLVDMKSDGIEVRPLREITGAAMFNEVFFTDVFVPDDCVVGAVNGGWRLARTTLANERVSMSSGASFGLGIEAMLGSLDSGPWADDAVVLDEIGALLAEAQSIALLGARTTLRSVSGVEPGPEASVRKLLGVEHEQRVQELGLVLLGAEGASTEGAGAQWSHGFLSTRCLTIAGGTSEVQRNVIGERILGLPRDPEPGS
jgi:alkylation response protein AidB-like acyl-CoA dehydrogenase